MDKLHSGGLIFGCTWLPSCIAHSSFVYGRRPLVQDSSFRSHIYICIYEQGVIGIGETNVAVAAKQRSVVLPDSIKTMVSQLPWLACLVWLVGFAVLAPLPSWLGWLGWQDRIAKSA